MGSSHALSTCLLNAGPKNTERTRTQFCPSLHTHLEVTTSHLFHQVLNLGGDMGLGLVSTSVPAGDMLHFAMHVSLLHTYACLDTCIPICVLTKVPSDHVTPLP